MLVDDTPRIANMYDTKVIQLDKPGVGYATYVCVIENKREIIIRTSADATLRPGVRRIKNARFNSISRKHSRCGKSQGKRFWVSLTKI